LKGDYDKLGLMHNRGMLMYGPPGMGKTSLISQVSDMIVARGDVVLYAKRIDTLIEGLNAFREVEPDRKCVVVLEDADEYVGYQEREFLQLLDGEKSVDGVLYLATTNYLERFPARLLRPGRFDKQVFVGAPPYEGRLAYLTNKLKDSEQAKEIERLARETDGMSFGHLRELITAVYALKEPVADVLRRLKASLKPGRKEYEEKLAAVKAKAFTAESRAKVVTGDDGEEGDPAVKEVTREIAPAKRVAAVVEVSAPAEPVVKHVHRFIEPPTPDVAVKTHKVVVRTLSKLRGRVWVDED
jgi:cell division protease FtsH